MTNNRKIAFFIPFDFCSIDLRMRQVCSEYDVDKLMCHKHFMPRFFSKSGLLCVCSLLFEVKHVFQKGFPYGLNDRLKQFLECYLCLMIL